MISQRMRPAISRNSPPHSAVAILLSIALLISTYALLRFGGNWGEGDTANATWAIRDILDTGQLDPGPGRYVYPNGYSFQALAVFLSSLGGWSLAGVQLFGSLLLIVVIVLPAWLLYRELTASKRAATLATIILLVQPEFLFPIMRGTHEKFTRALMLLCIYFLVRSLRSRNSTARLAGFILAYYLSIYALISLNNLLATSFIVALLLALVLLWTFTRRQKTKRSIPRLTLRRLFYIVLASPALVYLFTFYLYQPAQHDIIVLDSIIDRVSTLFLEVESAATNPYTTWVAGAWINTPVYFLLTLGNWLLLLASTAIWSWQSYQWLRYRRSPKGAHKMILWAFFGAFAAIGALSILVDFSGALSANLQHRVFPSFAMIAAPLVAAWLLEWRPRNSFSALWVSRALWIGLGLLALLAVLKATNEPLFSNKWLFYVPAEMDAIDWAGDKLEDRTLWTESDERLVTAQGIRSAGEPSGIWLDQSDIDPGTRDLLLSDVTRARALRLGQPLPVGSDSFATYDNGRAQIYHLRPRTPFQR